MAIVLRHVSTDGLLRLVVHAEDGDWAVGFEGYSWHTHGDLLALEYGGTPVAAVRAFAEDVVSSRRIIVVSRVDGRVADVWVTDDPSRDETKYALPGETIEKRFWDGRAATP